MARRNLSDIVRYLRRLANAEHASGCSDAALLERYVHCRDEAAFELLLWRHGVMVFNVCRRILPREQDAEDAFQATFLAFARKAHSINRRTSVSSWLYKVAYRVALEARKRTRKTAAMEKTGVETLAVQSASDPVYSDVRPILDEELSRLPERLRRPLILCYLEGKSNEEAARELGCRLGTIYSRLSRGREMLRKRLLRRGVTLSIAALTAQTTEAAMISSRVRVAVAAARSWAGLPMGGPISPRAAALAEGVLRTMFIAKLKIAVLVVFAAGVVTVGGVLSHTLTAAPQAETKAKDPPPKQEADDKPDAKAIAVKVVKPSPGGLAQTAVMQGLVEAAQKQQIVPLVSGTVKKVNVDMGDQVKKGQVLIVLDAPLLVKEAEQAAAALEMAQARMEEAKVAVAAENNLIRNTLGGGDEFKLKRARAALKAAEANVKIAQAMKDKARIRESFTRITAEFDGVVAERNCDPGNLVRSGESGGQEPLLTLVRMNRVRVKVSLAASIAGIAERGDPVAITHRPHGFRPGGRAKMTDLPGDPKKIITGQKIARISPIINGPNSMRSAEIDVDNPRNRLVPGMAALVWIQMNKTRSPKAFTLPASCLVSREGEVVVEKDKAYLYVVRDGKAHRTPIRAVFPIPEDRVEIVGGVKASDRIVVNPKDLKGDIVPIKVKKTP